MELDPLEVAVVGKILRSADRRGTLSMIKAS
jgi:hypothetical protein